VRSVAPLVLDISNTGTAVSNPARSTYVCPYVVLSCLVSKLHCDVSEREEILCASILCAVRKNLR
jgi:hypothetical protein